MRPLEVLKARIEDRRRRALNSEIQKPLDVLRERHEKTEIRAKRVSILKRVGIR